MRTQCLLATEGDRSVSSMGRSTQHADLKTERWRARPGRRIRAGRPGVSGMQWTGTTAAARGRHPAPAQTAPPGLSASRTYTHASFEAVRSGAPRLSIGTLTTHIEHTNRTLLVTWYVCSEYSQKHFRLAGCATEQWLVVASRGHESKSFCVQASGVVGSDHPGSCVASAGQLGVHYNFIHTIGLAIVSLARINTWWMWPHPNQARRGRPKTEASSSVRCIRGPYTL